MYSQASFCGRRIIMVLFRFSFFYMAFILFINAITLSAQAGLPAVLQRHDRAAEVAIKNAFPSNRGTLYIIGNDVSATNIDATTTYTLKNVQIERKNGYPTDWSKLSMPSVKLIFSSNTGEDRIIDFDIPSDYLDHDSTFYEGNHIFMSNNLYLPTENCSRLINFRMGIFQVGRLRIGDLAFLTQLSEQIRNPLPIIGKWRMISGNQTTIMTFHDDDTYTVEVNSTPREVGTYSFTGTQITIIPTHVYNTSTRRLVDAPRQTRVIVNYTRSGNRMTLEGRGTFTFME